MAVEAARRLGFIDAGAGLVELIQERAAAVEAIIGDASPADAPPPRPDWSPEATQYAVGYAAGYYAHMHMEFGRESVERFMAYESAR